MTFTIDTYDDLLALHRVIMEAKFSEHPNDFLIQGSPIVSDIAHRIAEALTAFDIQNEGASAKLKWQTWRNFSKEHREFAIVQAKLKSDSSWKNLSAKEQSDYVRNLVSPFTIDEELIRELLK